MKREASTVLYTHGGGRFGNQLLRFLHWIAWVLESDTDRAVINMAFWPYACYFSTWVAHPGCEFPLQPGWPNRVARLRQLVPAGWRHRFDWRMQRWTARLAPLGRRLGVATVDVSADAPLDLDSREGRSWIPPGKRTVCSGWRISCWRALEKHAATIRALFDPRLNSARRSRAFLENCRERHDFLVGLLVRRSDYRDWADGRFFFPLESYARWACELAEINADRNAAVLVAAEEQLPADLFGRTPVVYTTGSANVGGHWFDSFLQLAACDLIVSPPSTFSACAAFLGERPLMVTENASQSVRDMETLPQHLFDAARHPVFSRGVK